jgi:hypothetical protein
VVYHFCQGKILRDTSQSGSQALSARANHLAYFVNAGFNAQAFGAFTPANTVLGLLRLVSLDERQQDLSGYNFNDVLYFFRINNHLYPLFSSG